MNPAFLMMPLSGTRCPHTVIMPPTWSSEVQNTSAEQVSPANCSRIPHETADWEISTSATSPGEEQAVTVSKPAGSGDLVAFYFIENMVGAHRLELWTSCV